MKSRCSAALLGILLVGQAPGKTIPNHATADRVLGQSDFTTNTSPSPSSSFGISYPTAVVVDQVTRKVFVAEFGTNRVLRFPNADALANGAGAEAVFGQASFSDAAGAATRSGMFHPGGLFLDRLGRLWVGDTSNNRVLMFEAASYRSNQPSPERVFGQSDFTTGTPGTTSQKMTGPIGVWVDASDTLWVADSGNNRVLRFDTVSNNPIQDSAADAVLGQADFNTGTPGAGAAGFQYPTSLAVSSTGALFVTCTNASRVLRFNGAGALASGLNNASGVLGQLDFTGTTFGLSATQMSYPYGVTVTPDDSLWVCDGFNNRVIRFDQASTKTSGSAANGVVGQPDFTTNTPATTDRGLNRPLYQAFVDATGSLWVCDDTNNRVLRFPADVTRPALAVTSTVPKSTSAKKVSIKGTASDTYGISKVTYKVNADSTKTATGTTSWQFNVPLKKGKNTITIYAVDSVANKSVRKVLKIVRK